MFESSMFNAKSPGESFLPIAVLALLAVGTVVGVAIWFLGGMPL